MSIALADIIALLAVFLIGLPHGAFDGAAAMRTRLFDSLPRMIIFLSLYVTLAVLTLITWLSIPVISLGIFLLISLFHFGMSEPVLHGRIARISRIIASGGLTVIYLPLEHRDSVLPIFEILSGSESRLIITAIAFAAPLWVLASIVALIFSFMQKSERVWGLEFILLLALLTLLPPLAGFAIYFCCVHSRNHFRDIWRQLRQSYVRRHLILGAAVLTSLSWLFAVTAFWYLAPLLGDYAAALQIAFIGLAALTVPHMLLIDFIFRPSTSSLSGSAQIDKPHKAVS